MKRCTWGQSEVMQEYHDTEWGVPLHDDRMLFEFIILDGMQAGLSWGTILRKRARFRQVFDDFDPLKVAQYDDKKFAELLADPGIIRNRLKINAAIQNARAFIDIQREFGTFDCYIWQFVGNHCVVNQWQTDHEIPSQTPASEAMSRGLIERGFKFVGPTICYAFMQAAGLVNDHTVDCFRYKQLLENQDK
jgi:DNA-3-methyladenine glycosylase I